MVIGYARRQQMFFYEIHEGDEELGTAVLLAHERDLEPLEFFALVKKARTVVRRPRELAERSDIVVTMVTSSPDVEAVPFGPDGIAAGARPELLAIDMSTISPAASREIAKRAAANKPPFHTLDAPVSGGEVGAIERSEERR